MTTTTSTITTTTTSTITSNTTSIITQLTGVMFQISSVESDDGGNYTCAPNNIHPHSVIVNIMDTEGKYAAVHRDGTSRGVSLEMEVLVWSVLIICDKYVM